jgi:nucleotide-binding universal stress UspA family protein
MSGIRMQHILCPVDFSEPSKHALKYAVTLSRRYGAALTVVHVVESILPSSEDTTVSWQAYPEVEKRLVDFLGEVVATHGPLEERTDMIARRGSAFVEIVRTAREQEVDLIVIATHGYRGLMHALLGSTAEHVAQHAPCPVLTIKHPDHGFIMASAAEQGASHVPRIEIENILYPTDFSDFARYALPYAASFAGEFNATLYMLAVEDAMPYGFPGEHENFPDPKEVERLAHEASEGADAPHRDLKIRRFEVRGIPSHQIAIFARNYHIDLIVMSTHGKTGLKHALMGSTTERVMRLAPCPVLSIHHPEHEFVMP